MATIRVRTGARGVTYHAQVRMSGHRPITKSFPTRSAAKTWAREIESKLAKGELADSEAERHTLAGACEQYLKTHLDIDHDHARIVRWWRDTHGRRVLAKVSTPWLTEVRDELAAGTFVRGRPRLDAPHKAPLVERKRSPATVNRRLAYLRTVLSYCVEIGWMTRVPKVSKFTEAKRVRFLSEDELAALTKVLERCDERVMLPFVYCAISSGARAGELLSLEWKDVDLRKGVALIHKSKNTDGRKLYFRGRALELLEDFAKVRNLKSPGVFLMNSGRPLNHSAYHKLFRDACKAAGIENFRFHDLRHTAASFLAQNGATLLEIQQVLGHRTPAMTARYAHLVESHVESVVDRVMTSKLTGAHKGAQR
jgi:integrase